jgi:hypothetical protein
MRTRAHLIGPSWRLAACAWSLLVTWQLLLAGPATASPLQDTAAELACGDRGAVERALTALESAPVSRFGLPDESLSGRDTELRSVAYDAVLDALARAKLRFPELTHRIGALIEHWDFCALTADDNRWDLALLDGKVERRAPSRMSPFMGDGFAAWGLIPRIDHGRPRWSPDAITGLDSTFVAQCPSQPILDVTPSGPLPAIPAGSAEPDGGCRGPPPLLAPLAMVVGPAETPAPRRDPAVTTNSIAKTAQPPREHPEFASPDTRDGAIPLPGTIAAQFSAGVTGTLSSGLSASVAPVARTFLRTGLSWRLATKWDESFDLEPSWSWGLGYDDWRVGTVSVQLNHWGPIRSNSGWLALKGAVANLGYKVPLPRVLGRYLSARTDLSSPLTWSPSVGFGLALKLPFAMFLSVGCSIKLLEQATPTWSYVVGRSQWKAGTLAVVAANYGPNQIPDLNPRGISISASWSWAF